jgi:large subunit ribosomal protein L2
MESSPLKTYKALTPSTRQRVQVNFSNLLSGHTPLKFLIKGLHQKGGRNSSGRLTAFRKGGGHSKKYRVLSTKTHQKFLPFSVVHSVEYDPFRSSFICCSFLKETGTFQYILAPQNIKVGNFLSANYSLRRPNDGSASLLFYTNIGDFLYNVNLNNGPNAYPVATSAGTFCKIIKKEIQQFFSIIQLPSGGFRSVSLASLGFLGKTSNSNHKFEVIGKAGRSRWLGIRPSTRGSAQNPIDHPHGGGEGKSSSGRPSVTPWGWITKGQPTRKKKKDLYILAQK